MEAPDELLADHDGDSDQGVHLRGAVKDAKNSIALLVQLGGNQIFIPVRLGYLP